MRLVSLGMLESQGWGVCLQNGGMELTNRDGDVFTNVEKVNNVYPMEPRLDWLRGRTLASTRN